MNAYTQTNFATTHKERKLILKNDRLRNRIDILDQIIDYKELQLAHKDRQLAYKD